MKIAILGGGMTGLTTAYYLSKKNYRITVFEKEKVLGGLASGFKVNNWDWNLERTYHHLFANDTDILNFAREIGFEKIFYKTPETASLFNNEAREQLTILPLDTPLDLLKFPYLPLVDKLRTGIIIAFLKFSPFLSLYERQTAEEFLKKTMGKKVWNVLWKQLFRGKYGNYAGIILASFIWARIKKRTKKLGYIEGGFQALVDYLATLLRGLKVNVLTGYEIKEIKKRGEKYFIDNQVFDAIISTLPTPILVNISKKVFPINYLDKLSKIKYLHALTLILETDKPILDKTYWLNISTPDVPIMGIVQHTNFVDKKNYGNKHITYAAWYVNEENKLWKMGDKQIIDFVIKNLKLIKNFKYKISNHFVFRSKFAQPIFDKEFLKNKPDFITPAKNFFIANLDMTYPYDRGVNYAVKLGKEISKFIL